MFIGGGNFVLGSSGANGSNAPLSANVTSGKKWVVTKTVDIKGKPVCWCIPVEVKSEKEINVTFDKSNTFDLQAAYDKAMAEPVSTGDKDSYTKESSEITSRKMMGLAAEANSDEAMVITEVENLGGAVTIKGEGPDRSVVGVNLRKTAVTDKTLEHLKSLKHLQRLDLPLTEVTNTGLKGIKTLTQLRSLDL